jgi:hypothetical protein
MSISDRGVSANANNGARPPPVIEALQERRLCRALVIAGCKAEEGRESRSWDSAKSNPRSHMRQLEHSNWRSNEA